MFIFPTMTATFHYVTSDKEDNQRWKGRLIELHTLTEECYRTVLPVIIEKIVAASCTPLIMFLTPSISTPSHPLPSPLPLSHLLAWNNTETLDARLAQCKQMFLTAVVTSSVTYADKKSTSPRDDTFDAHEHTEHGWIVVCVFQAPLELER